jgi:tetratricopeptide (TPR) repeat protein
MTLPLNKPVRFVLLDLLRLNKLVLLLTFVLGAGNISASEIKQSSFDRGSKNIGTNLVVKDMELIGVSKRYSFLGRGFVELIQLAMLQHPDVSTVPRGLLWHTLRQSKIPVEEMVTDRLFFDDVLDHPKIQAGYVLSGKIVGLGDTFQLSSTLTSRRTGEEKVLGPYVFNEKEVISTAEFLAEDINLAMLHKVTGSSNHEVPVFICAENVAKNRQAAYTTPDLTSYLAANIREQPGFYPKVKYALERDCYTKVKKDENWKSEKTAALVFIKVGMEIDNNAKRDESLKIVVKPTLFVNKAGLSVSMVELIERVDRLATLRSNLLTVAMSYVKKTAEDEGLRELSFLAQLDAASLQDPSVNADIMQGKSLFESGEEIFALPFFQRAIRKDRSNQEANYYIGRILTMHKRYNESVEFYQSAIGGKSEFPQGFVALGDNYFANGDYIEAKRQYERALEIDSANLQAKRGLAYISLFSDDLNAANMKFQEIIEENPKDIDSMNALGSIAIKQEEYRKAVYWFNKSLDIDPANDRARSSLSVAYDRLSEQAESNHDSKIAIQYITKKIHLKDSIASYGLADDVYKRAQLHLVNAAYSDESAQNAIADLTYLNEITDDGEEHKYVLAKTDLAIAYLIAGKYDESKKLIVDSLYVYQENPEITVLNRAVHIAASQLLGEDADFQYHLLSEQIQYLKQPRKISDALNKRYELIREYFKESDYIDRKKKRELLKVTYTAQGINTTTTN